MEKQWRTKAEASIMILGPYHNKLETWRGIRTTSEQGMKGNKTALDLCRIKNSVKNNGIENKTSNDLEGTNVHQTIFSRLLGV